MILPFAVVAVSNGIGAWKILEDLNNQIDLVLTEVVMPGLSGIGLLSKIMSHKSCQNIPVISEFSFRYVIIVRSARNFCYSSVFFVYLNFPLFTCNASVNFRAVMSAHDSMGIVLKCLSKGAADFLLKPIRKNELKFLWQHVWRRCHSVSSELCSNLSSSCFNCHAAHTLFFPVLVFSLVVMGARAAYGMKNLLESSVLKSWTITLTVMMTA